MTTLTFGEILDVVNLAGLQRKFSDECFDAAAEPRWNMKAVTEFLTRYNLPQTSEELETSLRYVFKTALAGKTDLAKGDYVVLCPEQIVGSHSFVEDIGKHIILIRALQDVHFDAELDLIAGNSKDLRIALLPYLDNGMIEIIETVSARVYNTHTAIVATEE